MDIPFSTSQFMKVMAAYNMAVWPAQVGLLLLAVAALYFTYYRTSRSDRLIFYILAFLWAWIGVMYHWMHFTSINNAAWLFGAFFVVQALIFVYFGYRNNTGFAFSNTATSWTGTLFIIYALVIYPLLGHAFGHTYPASPTFGLPCPTTIFTFGILLQGRRILPWWLWTIPLLWSLIGMSAAFNFGIYEDYGLLVAGLVGSYMLWSKNRAMRNKIRTT